jgi:hypothetical protein
MVHGDACIDHILWLAPQDGDRLKVQSVSIVFDWADPESGILASDHFGVRVSIA